MRTAEEIATELAEAEHDRRTYVHQTEEMVRALKATRYDGEAALAIRVSELRRESRARADADALVNAHPWTGKIVERTVDKRARPWSQPKPVTIRGVVEIVTSKTQWPANRAQWRTPHVGGAFVRILLANGKPGLAWDTLGDGKWKLVEATDGLR